MDITKLTWRQDVRVDDVAKIRKLAASTGVFSEEEVIVAGELLEECLVKSDVSGYQFLFVEDANQIIGYSCFGLIPFTDQRIDLYWIAIDPNYQKQGLGKLLLQRTEKIIAALGGLHIYAETSGRAIYLPTRNFYSRNGYLKVAELDNYYREGDSKVIYCKYL